MKKTLVLGTGNILLKDEGIGVLAVEALSKQYALPKGLACLDGGVAGLSLLQVIEEYDNLVIIDAVNSGRPPGTIERVEWQNIKDSPVSATTAHQIGLNELLTLAGFEGRSPHTVIIGIVPLDITPGSAPSQLIMAKLPELLAAVIKELEEMGYKLKKRIRHA